MKLSPQQEIAKAAIQTWLDDSSAPQVFRLFGFAGTGKSTIADLCVQSVKGKVQFACFTGKAALVLRKKGCDNACTLHSLLYKPEEVEEKDEFGKVIGKKIEFRFNWESELADAALLVVDEVSMVGEELGEDALRHGVKVLVLGDPGQLPPIKGQGFFVSDKPNVQLTEIHRQAADSPIIKLASMAREGQHIPEGEYGQGCSVIDRNVVGREYIRDIVDGADMLLCGMNKTRMGLNNRVRQIRGIEDTYPVVGDRLVCLKNNREKGLLNGGLWDVKEVTPNPKDIDVLLLTLQSIDEPEKTPVEVGVHKAFFTGEEKELDYWKRRDSDEFTYGYALTVHKSQGSQWDHVVIFDESNVFRNDANKHRYTAITRAAKRVTIIR